MPFRDPPCPSGSYKVSTGEFGQYGCKYETVVPFDYGGLIAGAIVFAAVILALAIRFPPHPSRRRRRR